MDIDKFEARVRHHDGIYVVSIPELNLTAKGESVAEALALLDGKKRGLQAELAEAGVDLEPDRNAVPVAAGPPRMSLGYEMLRFGVKAVIVFVLIIGSSLY